MASSSSSGGNSAFPNLADDFSHVLDPNERRRIALAEIDNGSFGWHHARAVMVAGIGFFTDAYDVSTPPAPGALNLGRTETVLILP